MATSKVVVTPEDQLKRFLYTSNEDPKFITGNPEYYKAYLPDKLTSVPKLLSSTNPECLLNIIEKINSENLLSRPETLFFALSVAANITTNEALKHNIFVTLTNIVKTSEDLCLFLKFYTKQKKKFGTAVNKVISSYYMKKDINALLDEIIKSKGFHSWTHKDLIKLSHCRSTTVELTVIVRYILFGLDNAVKVAEENSALTPIIEKLKKAQELKRCESEARIVELIKELHCSHLTQVPSFYHNNPTVWEALLPELPIRDVISNLPKLYKLGFLKANTPFQNKVVECLTNTEKIQSSQLHPVEVLIGLRNFEKGGKPLDPKFVTYLKHLEEDKKDDPNFKKIEYNREPPKCPNIISALHRTLQYSFQNPHSTGRRMLIAIDVNEKMEKPCLTTKNISAMDAAVILTLSLLKVEKDVTVVVFNDNYKITPITMEKNISLNAALSKLKQHKCERVAPSAAIEWAINKKKHIDVFINLIHHHHWLQVLPKEVRDKEKPVEVLNKYRKRMALPNTKLITFSLCTPHQSIADGSPNILDISGFSKEVPKVIEAFNRGLFY